MARELRRAWIRCSLVPTVLLGLLPLQPYASAQQSVKQKLVYSEVPTVAGQLDVFRVYFEDGTDTRVQVRLAGKPLFEEPEYQIVSVKAAYPDPGPARLLLLELTTGGSACPAFYRVLAVRRDGGATRTAHFGNCSPLAKATFKDGTLGIEIPRIGGAPAESWRYRAGKLWRIGGEPSRQPRRPADERAAREKAEAAERYRNACTGGDPEACNNLGRAYSYGEGVPRDKVKAAELFEKACDGRHAGACGSLGALYASVLPAGVPRDDAKAVQLYQKACDGGNAEGCNNLGLRYVHGDGVAADRVKASQLFQKACDGGHAHACIVLGERYLHGTGVAPDGDKATQLYKKACDAGDAEGCYRLGMALYDQHKAAQLYQKACSLGSSEACETLERLAITPTRSRAKP